jgi:hypothetical protein
VTQTPHHQNGATKPQDEDNSSGTRVLYCHCKYAKVIAPEMKAKVLAGLCDSGIAFESVADLCEMSARKDPTLARLASPGNTKIAACYPRAVKWLFHAAGTPLPEEGVEVLNMREQDADEILGALLGESI